MIFRMFRKFAKDSSGATAIEYGLIAALVSIAAIAGFNALGGALDTTFTNVSGYLSVGPAAEQPAAPDPNATPE